LHGVDAATCKAISKLTMQHRSNRQLPEEQRPTYETRGQHLHGTDAAIFERVRAEVAAVHGGALAAVGAVEKKWLGDARAK